MKADAKLGLFVFLVLLISVFFLVAHELSQRGVEPPVNDAATSASVDPSTPPAIGSDARVTSTGALLPPQRPSPAPSPSMERDSASRSPATVPVGAGREDLGAVPSDYAVASGDSLWTISKKVYGNGAHWRKIYEANQDRLSSPEASLKVGMRLMIPQSEAALSGLAAARPEAVRQDFSGADGIGGAGRTHMVASGDSLYTIAKQYYGNGAKTKTDVIYAANRDKLRSPDSLKIGMMLTIPEMEPIQ